MSRNTTASRPNVQWVPIEQVIPNPLNPRKNDAIKTEEMQAIILNRGWEIPLTVYKKGSFYVVLSGHRRLYAAKQTRTLREIPVYVTEAPENHQEEVERIASLQRGQVDWSPYEWAKFTFERWIAWGKPGMEAFSDKIGIGRRTVTEYIQVLQYFPRQEIETGLETKIYNMSTLANMVEFMKKLKSHKSVLVESMTEEMIRKTMLYKMEKKLISRDALRRATTELVPVVSDADFTEFLTTSNMDLQDLLDAYSIALKPAKTLHGRLVSIGIANKNIADTDIPYNAKEQEKLLNALEDIQKAVKKKISELKKVMK